MGILRAREHEAQPRCEGVYQDGRTSWGGRGGYVVGIMMVCSLKGKVGIDPVRLGGGEEVGGRQGILGTRDHLPEKVKLFPKASFAKLVLISRKTS